MSLPELVVIAGATASGKSALAMALARRFNAEIISGDSMQLYRHLDIGTAKPTASERSEVPHHLLDIFDISEPVDVYRFLDLAEEAIKGVSARGALPIVAGGSGMYLKSLLYGLDDLPGDAAVRAELDAKYDNEPGGEELKQVMAVRDPEALAKWGGHRRKLIRALEVLTVSGTSLLTLQRGERALRYRARVLVLELPREVLKSRIAERTRAMLEAGWVAEAESAINAGLMATPTAHQALGYSVIGEFLAGRMGYEEMESTIVTKTWQFARRQLTWFKHQHPEAEFIRYDIGIDEVISLIQRSWER